MKKILYLTDLYYEAKGRKYYEEDLNPYLSLQLVDDHTRSVFLDDLSRAFNEMIR